MRRSLLFQKRSVLLGLFVFGTFLSLSWYHPRPVRADPPAGCLVQYDGGAGYDHEDGCIHHRRQYYCPGNEGTGGQPYCDCDVISCDEGVLGEFCDCYGNPVVY